MASAIGAAKILLMKVEVNRSVEMSIASDRRDDTTGTFNLLMSSFPSSMLI
jgi:hypothetical protein